MKEGRQAGRKAVKLAGGRKEGLEEARGPRWKKADPAVKRQISMS